MNAELLRDYCLQKKAVTEHFPFDEVTLVFKVAGKMFCLIGLDAPDRCNLKCDPEYAVELRSNYHAISPGWHMSKTHWNTVQFNEDVDDRMVFQLIDHSYDEVVRGLTKKVRAEHQL